VGNNSYRKTNLDHQQSIHNTKMAIINLTTCNTSIEANMIKGLLDSEGIECFLTNENFTTLMPGYNGMLGSGIQVMIDEAEYERATEILSKQTTEELKCPNCGSENIIFGLGEKKFKKIVVVILSALFAIPFNNIRNTYYCKDCKTEFKKAEMR